MDMTSFSPAVVLLTVVTLALAPFVAVMVTSFTKIVVVLSLLRNALGLQQVPPNVVINGLAIVLSVYVMNPVILDVQAAINGRPPVTATAPVPVNQTTPTAPTAAAGTATGADPVPPQSPAAVDAVAAEAQAQRVADTASTRGPQFANVRGTDSAAPAPVAAASAPTDIAAAAATSGTGSGSAPIAAAAGGGKLDLDRILKMIEVGREPLRKFLIQHSRDAERAFFLRSAQRLLPPASRSTISANDFVVVIPAFTVSELTAAFQIGFLIYLPFLIIDLVVANILLALGMMMMSPTTVSLPFKLLLFVLIDGWAKLVHGLVLTYGV